MFKPVTAIYSGTFDPPPWGTRTWSAVPRSFFRA